MLSSKTKLALIWTLSLGTLLYLGAGAYRITKWNAQRWLPTYVGQELKQLAQHRVAPQHIIFTMVDHYEPGFEPSEAIERNQRWLDKYDKIAAQHTDSYGNAFRYTWFYPYDQPHDQVMLRLNQSVRKGFGEIEFHWHHPQSNNELFPSQVQEAVAWFNRFGAMVSSKPPHRSQFAFIHGNWILDGSSPACGVSNEIAVLQAHGGYMDMTFSTIGTLAQPPRKINSIYYVVDDDRPRSYDVGTDAAVGKVVENGFLMFQGPIGAGFDLSIEYGAVEDYAVPSPQRIRKWIDTGIHVAGRPEWVFIKVYSHGIQSQTIIDQHMAPMLADLKNEVESRGAALHFMTAREAYNVVKAAEAGMGGDPERYRDYLLAKPVNAVEATPTVEMILAAASGNKVSETR